MRNIERRTQRELEILHDLQSVESKTGYIHTEYYKLDKQLLDDYSARIYLPPFAEILSRCPAYRHQYLAGWMYTEAALSMNESPEQTRQEMVNAAAECWDYAHELAQARDEAREPYCVFNIPSLNTLQCEASQATLDIARAIASGDVDENSRNNLYNDLLLVAARTSNTYEELLSNNSPQASPYYGLLHELNAMLIINRLRSTSLIALPALPRSDRGDEINYALTHDVQVLNTRWGDIRHVQAIEVKATPKTCHYNRYTAAIVGGTVHLHPHNQGNPGQLTELLVKENLNLANNDEIALLDQATDRVVHAIRHGYNKTEQCRNTEECELYGLERNNHHNRDLANF